MEEAVGKVFGSWRGRHRPLVVLGDRLGLWAALAEAGPATPNELASRTGTVERYVREWLRGVAVAGYVGYDPATGAFTLSDEMAPVLATDDSPASLIGVFEGFVGMWNDLARSRGSSASAAG
jgi:DNA-binding IclR family transcriptional regulator